MASGRRGGFDPRREKQRDFRRHGPTPSRRAKCRCSYCVGRHLAAACGDTERDERRAGVALRAQVAR